MSIAIVVLGLKGCNTEWHKNVHGQELKNEFSKETKVYCFRAEWGLQTKHTTYVHNKGEQDQQVPDNQPRY